MNTSNSGDVDQELENILVDDLVDATVEAGDENQLDNITPTGAVRSQEKVKQIVESELDKLCEELDIDSATRNTARSLFDQYYDSQDLVGNAIEMITAACLYIACKVNSVPLTPDDFEAVEDSIATRKLLLRRSKTIASKLGLSAEIFTDATQYVDRYCDALDLDSAIAERAKEIIAAAEGTGIASGKSPTGWAAAAIYNANLEAGRLVTQEDIQRETGVTTVTIRNRYQDQHKALDMIADDHSNPALRKKLPDGGTDSLSDKYENQSAALESDEDRNNPDSDFELARLDRYTKDDVEP